MEQRVINHLPWSCNIPNMPKFETIKRTIKHMPFWSVAMEHRKNTPEYDQIKELVLLRRLLCEEIENRAPTGIRYKEALLHYEDMLQSVLSV